MFLGFDYILSKMEGGQNYMPPDSNPPPPQQQYVQQYSEGASSQGKENSCLHLIPIVFFCFFRTSTVTSIQVSAS